MARLSVDVEKLKQYMQDHDITPAQLAAAMGVSRAAVSRVLNRVRGAGSRFIGSLLTAFPDAWDRGIVFVSGRSRKVTKDERDQSRSSQATRTA